MGVMVVLVLIINGILAIIPAKIAYDKGRDMGAWYVYGFFLWIIAVIHASCLSDDNTQQQSNTPKVDLTKAIVNDICTIDVKCPITISKIEIVKTDQGDYLLKVDFKTFTTKKVKAIKLKAIGYNLLNEKIHVNDEETFEIIIQDILYNGTYTSFCNEYYIPLPNNDIRNVELSITQIAYEDGDVVSEIEHRLLDVEIKEIVPFEKKVVAKQLIPTAKYFPKEGDDFWICTCGTPNSKENEICTKCSILKSELFEKLSDSNFKKKYNSYMKEEADRRAKEDIQRRNRNILITSIIGIIVIIFIALMATYAVSLNSYNEINSGDLYLNSENYINKQIKISGEISSIYKYTNYHILTIQTKGYYDPVRIYYPLDTNYEQTYVGDDITVKGVFNGLLDGSTPSVTADVIKIDQ